MNFPAAVRLALPALAACNTYNFGNKLQFFKFI